MCADHPAVRPGWPDPMGIDPSKRYTATMETTLDVGHTNLGHRHRARRGQRTQHGQQLRLPRRLPLLRRHHLPPHHQRLHVPGWRPHRHRPWRPRLPFNDEPVKQRYQLGSLAMANAGPNTNGSQFFLISGASGVGLPPQYNHFGQSREGPRDRRRDAEAWTPTAATARVKTSSSTRSPSPSPTDPRVVAVERLSLAQARRIALAAQGFRRPAPHRRVSIGGTSAAPSTGWAHPDRLGQRAGAQPGAAAVRAPRPASAHDDRRGHRGG
jgi:cyclophilin family peptidyl-prolyl cis-trans isomerase